MLPKLFARGTFSFTGWTFNNQMPTNIKQCVMIAAPHTSNWDALYTRMAFVLMGIPVKITIKDSYMRFPYGPVIRYLGGIGINRRPKKEGEDRGSMVQLMADLFKTAGADRLMVVDLHTSQIQGFFDGPVDHLFALPLLANYVGSKVDRSRLTIVSPDSGRVRVAERWSELLGGAQIAFIHKTRDPRVPNEATVGRVVGEVEGRTCVVIDDMIDTAGTITKAVDSLLDAGATEVIIAATHAVFSGPAAERLRNSKVKEVVVTNTLPIPEESRFDNLTVLSIAPLLARAIREVFEDGSVTSLFDGHS